MAAESGIPDLRVRVELSELYDASFDLDHDDITAMIRNTAKKQIQREVELVMEKFRQRISNYLEPRVSALFQTAIDQLDALPEDQLVEIALKLEGNG